MNLRLTNLYFFIFLAMKSFAQEKAITISGNTLSFQNTVSNVHILNLSSKRGTISNENGEFELSVIKNDTLLISSIQHKKVKIIITEEHMISKKIIIYLKPTVTILDEVYLHGLTGSLNSDIDNTPIDTLPNHNFIIKKSDLAKKLPPDTHGFLNSPNAQDMTDPVKMNGVGGSARVPDYYMIKVRKLKRELKKKKAFPIQIKKELGINYFTNKLQIPIDEIDRFLAYCENKNIIEHYNKNNLLQVIKILQEESKTYHEIKN